MPPPGSGDGGVGPIADDARRRIEAIRAALMREIEDRLRRLDMSGGKLVGEKDSLDNARKIRSQVLQLMRDEGLPVVIGAAEQRVIDAVETALRSHTPARGATLDAHSMVGITMDADAKDAIARSVRGVFDDIAAVFDEGEEAMRKAIDVGLHTAAPFDELVEGVRAAMATTFARASTAVETAIRAAARTVNVDQAVKGAEAVGEEVLFVYVGPSDGKTREFCADIVGKAFTVDAMQALDNGTDLPADKFGGGHGCRHTWSAITREDAEAEGIEVVEA